MHRLLYLASNRGKKTCCENLLAAHSDASKKTKTRLQCTAMLPKKNENSLAAHSDADFFVKMDLDTYVHWPSLIEGFVVHQHFDIVWCNMVTCTSTFQYWMV